MHLAVGIVKVPDHLKPSPHPFSSPPLDSRWSEQTDINKYLTQGEFKGARMAFLLSSCQQRVNNGDIKICGGAATLLYQPEELKRSERCYWLLRAKWVSGVL